MSYILSDYFQPIILLFLGETSDSFVVAMHFGMNCEHELNTCYVKKDWLYRPNYLH